MGLPQLKGALKWVLLVCGWLSFALGVIGVVLPVLPTTPFMLLAAACFAKSSPRFHQWLLNSRVFGQFIRNWQEERYIEPKAKIRALIIVAITFSISIYIVDYVSLKWMLVGFLADLYLFYWTIAYDASVATRGLIVGVYVTEFEFQFVD